MEIEFTKDAFNSQANRDFGVVFESLPDDKKVLYHWLLFYIHTNNFTGFITDPLP